MNKVIKREIKKHVAKKKEIKPTDLIVTEIKKEMNKIKIHHTIK